MAARPRAVPCCFTITMGQDFTTKKRRHPRARHDQIVDPDILRDGVLHADVQARCRRPTNVTEIAL
jgi:hypothetical protein